MAERTDIGGQVCDKAAMGRGAVLASIAMFAAFSIGYLVADVRRPAATLCDCDTSALEARIAALEAADQDVKSDLIVRDQALLKTMAGMPYCSCDPLKVCRCADPQPTPVPEQIPPPPAPRTPDGEEIKTAPPKKPASRAVNPWSNCNRRGR